MDPFFFKTGTSCRHTEKATDHKTFHVQYFFYHVNNHHNLHLTAGDYALFYYLVVSIKTLDFWEKSLFSWGAMNLGVLKECPVKLNCRRQNRLRSLRQAGYMLPLWMNNLILKVYFKAAHQVVSLPTAASQPSRQSKIEQNDFLQMFNKTVSGW